MAAFMEKVITGKSSAICSLREHPKCEPRSRDAQGGSFAATDCIATPKSKYSEGCISVFG